MHFSDVRVGGCDYHVPRMGAFERRARGRVCLRQGMGAFDRRAWAGLLEARHGCI